MGQFGKALGSLVSPAAIIVLLVLVVCYQAAKAFFSPLRAIPGPFWARFTRAWYLRRVWQGDFEKTNIELHNKYGTQKASLISVL